jgi:hypothetical protein
LTRLLRAVLWHLGTGRAFDSIRSGVGIIHSHMLRHSCGYKLPNDGHDTRAIQAIAPSSRPRGIRRWRPVGLRISVRTDLRGRRSQKRPRDARMPGGCADIAATPLSLGIRAGRYRTSLSSSPTATLCSSRDATANPKPMPEGQQGHGAVAVPVPIGLGGLDQRFDLAGRQMLSGANAVAMAKVPSGRPRSCYPALDLIRKSALFGTLRCGGINSNPSAAAYGPTILHSGTAVASR